jgi:hypothetical protein
MTTITGTAGELRCKWQQAAVLSSWSITNGDASRVLSATVVNSNFWVSQQPLSFVAPKGLRWPVVTLEIAGASLTATLGPMELPHGPASPTS